MTPKRNQRKNLLTKRIKNDLNRGLEKEKSQQTRKFTDCKSLDGERDSNPRWVLAHNSFRELCLSWKMVEVRTKYYNLERGKRLEKWGF